MMLEINYFVMTILLLFNRLVICFRRKILFTILIIFIGFVLTPIWKLHALFVCFIYVIDETTLADKTSSILLVIEETTVV